MLTDAQVFAALRDDEREWFGASGSRNTPHGNCYARMRHQVHCPQRTYGDPARCGCGYSEAVKTVNAALSHD